MQSFFSSVRVINLKKMNRIHIIESRFVLKSNIIEGCPHAIRLKLFHLKNSTLQHWLNVVSQNSISQFFLKVLFLEFLISNSKSNFTNNWSKLHQYPWLGFAFLPEGGFGTNSHTTIKFEYFTIRIQHKYC